MKKLAIASALISAVAFTGTAAHAYQAEIGASAGLTDPDHAFRELFGEPEAV